MQDTAELTLRAPAEKAADGQRARHKIASLEIARFIASLSVIVWHYDHLFMAGAWTPEAAKSVHANGLPLAFLLAPFYHLGYAAVFVFWTISGFIFFFKYAETIYSKGITLRDFLIFRISRLYPLHFTTLILVTALQGVYALNHSSSFIYGPNDLTHFAAHLFMASNWFDGQPFTFNGPMWSVSAEVLVYLLFFLILRKVQPGLLAPVGALAMAFAISNLSIFDIARPVVHCAEYFFLGGIIEVVHSRLGRQGALVTNAIFALSFCVALACVYVNYWQGWPQPSRAWYFVFCVSFIVACVNSDQVIGRRALAACAVLGELTYSMYLLHFPVQMVMATLVDGAGWSRDWFYQLTPFLLYMSAVGVVSYFSYRLLELPAQEAIRRKFVRNYAVKAA